MPFRAIAPATKSLISNSGTWNPVCVVTCFENRPNLGTRVFAANPPSLPNSLNLYSTDTQNIKMGQKEQLLHRERRFRPQYFIVSESVSIILLDQLQG